MSGGFRLAVRRLARTLTLVGLSVPAIAQEPNRGPSDPDPGKLADMVLVDGDPLEDIDPIADPHRNVVLITRAGTMCKNALEGAHND